MNVKLLTAVAAVALGLGVATNAGAQTTAGKLPLGRYTCYQFSPSVGYLYWGYFSVLSPSTYRLYNGGSGRYSYSAPSRRITWLSGPYRQYRYRGEYQPKGTNGHKSNTIVLLGPESVKIECSTSK
jgi:hypothetical protein